MLNHNSDLAVDAAMTANGSKRTAATILGAIRFECLRPAVVSELFQFLVDYVGRRHGFDDKSLTFDWRAQ
jgi:hypothetical protein